jgi:hypothetical protein
MQVLRDGDHMRSGRLVPLSALAHRAALSVVPALITERMPIECDWKEESIVKYSSLIVADDLVSLKRWLN